jgi:hypothetical protein
LYYPPSCPGVFFPREIGDTKTWPLYPTLYLSHKGIIHLTQKWFTGLGLRGKQLDASYLYVFLYVGALIMRILIEKPFFRMRNKMISKV